VREAKCIIVTGAAGRLGRAVVSKLAKPGVRLLCVDRKVERLEPFVSALPSGAEVLTFAGADLRDPVTAMIMVEAAVDCFGGIDALVNTVGGLTTSRAAVDQSDKWDALIALNARVALVTSNAVLPVMQASRYGRIVHIAATPGLNYGVSQAVSKNAVIRLTEDIAAKHHADGITANCILPGTIDTPQNPAHLLVNEGADWVSVDPITRRIAFLVSPEAGSVTGRAY